MRIEDIRQKYPQYNDMSDQQLADAFHDKYYSDMPKSDFYQKIGFNGDIQNQPNQSPSYLQQVAHSPMQIGGDALAGLASAGNNLNHFITNNLLPSSVGNKINSYLPQQGADFSSAFGVSNPGMMDNLIQGVAQYAPYAMGGEAALGAKAAGLASRLGLQAITGAAFGGTQSNNPGTGAYVGAITAPLAELGIRGAMGAPRAVLNKLSQFSAPGLAKSVINDLSTPLTNEQAFNMAQANYGKFVDQEKNAWDDVSNKAAQVDQSGIQFDNSGYTDSLKGELDKLRTEASRQSALARKNKESIGLIQGNSNSNGYLNDTHDSFSNAIEHNQALNADFQNEVAPGQPLPLRTVIFAKSNLQKALADNLEKNGLQDTLGASWKNANQVTANKNQIFNEVINPKGKDDFSSFSAFLNGKSNFADRGNFVNDYLPNGSNESLGRMRQFSQMLGNEDAAKAILKKNYFNTDTGVTPESFIKGYNKLSPTERSYLFNNDQTQSVQALKNVLEKNPNALKQQSWFTNLWHHSLPFLIGGALGHEMGAPFMESGLMSALGSNLAGAGLKKAFSTPGMQRFFANYLNNSATRSASPLAQALSRSAQSAITPQPVNLTIDRYRSVAQ